MALLKEKILQNRLSGNYFRIVRISTLAKNGSEVFLGLFKDKAASDELGDAAIIDVQTFNFEIPKQCFIEGNVYEWIYNQIKAPKPQTDEDGNETESNWFANAEDC